MKNTLASEGGRIVLNRDRGTLRGGHSEAVRRLAALPVPPPLSVYDSDQALSHLLLDQAAYLRAVTDALAPVFERCADDAADYGGARSESFDLVRAAVEDFIAPISSAAHGLDE